MTTRSRPDLRALILADLRYLETQPATKSAHLGAALECIISGRGANELAAITLVRPRHPASSLIQAYSDAICAAESYREYLSTLHADGYGSWRPDVSPDEQMQYDSLLYGAIRLRQEIRVRVEGAAPPDGSSAARAALACHARSWTGRRCKLDAHPEDPIHEDDAGVRWRGNSDAMPGGELPDDLRAAFMAAVESSTFRSVPSDDVGRVTSAAFERVRDILSARCGVTWIWKPEHERCEADMPQDFPKWCRDQERTMVVRWLDRNGLGVVAESIRRGEHDPMLCRSDDDSAEWVTLESLPPGSIFATRDGVRAVKSECHYPGGGCEVVLLASGEHGHFNSGKLNGLTDAGGSKRRDDHNQTLVRAVPL